MIILKNQWRLILIPQVNTIDVIVLTIFHPISAFSPHFLFSLPTSFSSHSLLFPSPSLPSPLLSLPHPSLPTFHSLPTSHSLPPPILSPFPFSPHFLSLSTYLLTPPSPPPPPFPIFSLFPSFFLLPLLSHLFLFPSCLPIIVFYLHVFIKKVGEE